ncbi:MAG TPA: NAD-dependent epimerase/dehydratase family protein [Candidatus Sulfomarinibacteraceae bacterium]|nr:NAD-dependent epimerase/dehydratase family protein [Candidatus Sulfomarinibacteraceae bacterium]
MKAFVTGGTGFIGRHVVRKLLQRGNEVVALARSEQSAADLRAIGAEVARGDILDTDSMREPMRGADAVFHLAGWYRVGADDWLQAEAINVGGTRKVLRLAHELEIPKIVYASTVAVFGDTAGRLVDENYRSDGPFLSEYDRTKWLAHYKVAEPLIEEGAPIIIVMPGGVYGPGDHSLVGTMMELFYKGVPALPGPETTLTFAHVEDIAEGIILAAEKGQVGESYVLAGPAVPLGEMFDFWSYLTGKPAPPIRIPSRYLKPLAPVMGVLENLLPLPDWMSREAIEIMGATYTARADRARTKLGWQPRPLQAGMLETFEWIAESEATRPTGARERKIAGVALLAAAALFVLWLLGRRKNQS